MSNIEPNDSNVDFSGLLASINPEISRVLKSAIEGKDISASDACMLLDSDGLEYNATVLVADVLRRRTVGDVVTYVVNRNINFTNVCIKRCGFCAFSRDFREEQGYLLPVEEIVRRSKEAWDYGATEVAYRLAYLLKWRGICMFGYARR